MTLILDANLDRPDDVYAALLAAHDGLSKEESDAFNARLILLLANHIGDSMILAEAIAAARQGGNRRDTR